MRALARNGVRVSTADLRQAAERWRLTACAWQREYESMRRAATLACVVAVTAVLAALLGWAVVGGGP